MGIGYDGDRGEKGDKGQPCISLPTDPSQNGTIEAGLPGERGQKGEQVNNLFILDMY